MTPAAGRQAEFRLFPLVSLGMSLNDQLICLTVCPSGASLALEPKSLAGYGRIDKRRLLDYLSSHCRFRTGSISGRIGKEFDAVGVLMLVDQGKLSLNDPVSKFSPALPSWAATVTMDDLLHYTSGLPDVDWRTVKNDGDIWRNLRAVEQLNFPAGSHYTYNNTFLRRRVIEKVSGMSFAKFLQTQEFPKARVHDAVIDPTDGPPERRDPFISWPHETPNGRPASGMAK